VPVVIRRVPETVIVRELVVEEAPKKERVAPAFTVNTLFWCRSAPLMSRFPLRVNVEVLEDPDITELDPLAKLNVHWV
jgi:hypothetical protein